MENIKRNGQTAEKKLTGKHVLIMALSFFGVIFAMNFTFAYMAFSTFTGLDIDNAYHKGREYNKEITAANLQEKKHWQMDLKYELLGQDKILVRVASKDKHGEPLNGLDMRVKLRRPTQRHMDQQISLRADGSGTYQGIIPLPQKGQWDIILLGFQNKQEQYKSIQRVVLK